RDPRRDQGRRLEDPRPHLNPAFNPPWSGRPEIFPATRPGRAVGGAPGSELGAARGLAAAGIWRGVAVEFAAAAAAAARTALLGGRSFAVAGLTRFFGARFRYRLDVRLDTDRRLAGRRVLTVTVVGNQDRQGDHQADDHGDQQRDHELRA